MQNDDSTQTPARTPAQAAVPVAPRRRRWLLPVGIVAASLGLVAATAGVTAVALDETDDDDDRRSSAVAPQREGSDDDRDDVDAGGSAVSGPRTADAAGFEAARDAAVEAAGGGTVLELDLERDGWSAEVLDAGATIDVRLGTDLEVIRVEAPDAENDPAPTASLDGDALADALEAALADAGSGAATGVQLEDGSDATRVDVITADGTELEITLDGALDVVRTETSD